MEIELIPDPGAGSPVSLAVASAIVREGLVPEQPNEQLSFGVGSGGGGSRGSWSAAWRRTGLQEGVERSPHG